jgi:hypothetical protein
MNDLHLCHTVCKWLNERMNGADPYDVLKGPFVTTLTITDLESSITIEQNLLTDTDEIPEGRKGHLSITYSRPTKPEWLTKAKEVSEAALVKIRDWCSDEGRTVFLAETRLQSVEATLQGTTLVNWIANYQCAGFFGLQDGPESDPISLRTFRVSEDGRII